MGRKRSKPLKGKAYKDQGRSAPTHPVVRLASAMTDAKEKRIYFFTNDILINQLQREGPKIEASFDALCADDLADMSSLFSTSSALILSGCVVASKGQDNLRIACSQLLTNACGSFSAAVAVLRMGYVLQPGMILRSLLESVSMSLHLLQNQKDLDLYENHVLQSQKTISSAKKALPPFGFLYGSFSENFAHIGRLHKTITPICKYEEKHEALNVNLGMLRIAVWLLYVTAELVFNDLLEQPRYWFPVDQGYMFAPSDEEKAWMGSFFQPSTGPL